MKLVGDLISSLERVKIHNASCEDLHRRCQRLVTTLEENATHMDPDEALEAGRMIDNVLLAITKRVDEWSHLSLLESFIRRTEIQMGVRTMIINDLRIAANNLQVMGPEFELSAAETEHLDIQDSLQMRGILRYIADRPEELKSLAEGSFTPSDRQNFAMALQTDLRDKEISLEERNKLGDALWKLTTWTNMAPPILDLDVEARLCQGQSLIWTNNFTQVFVGLWGIHNVALTTTKALNTSVKSRLALEKNVISWSRLRHNHIKNIWGYFCSDGTLYVISPWMKHWDLTEYFRTDPPVDRFSLILNLATGLEFLHKQVPPVLVGLVTPLGVHISEKGKPCIADYGILPAILQTARDSSILNTTFNGRYFAPELLGQRRVEFSTASDVYGFAMLCFELLTGCPPFHHLTAEYDLVRCIQRGMLPERPQTNPSLRWLSDDIWDMLTRCWLQDPMFRPDMSSVVANLRLLQRARRDPSVLLTVNSQQRRPSVSSTKDTMPCGDGLKSQIYYATSGEILSASLTGLVSKLLSDTAGLSSDSVSNTFFHTYRAFTSPEVLLDTLEIVFQDNFSHANSVEARIATCYDLLNFLEAWLRRDRSYLPSYALTERMKNLVPIGSFSAPPTLVDRVTSLVQMIDEWFGNWTPSLSSVTIINPPRKRFDLGGMSPRLLAYGLTYIESELYYDILPPDFVQWHHNILCRAGRNGIRVFMDTYKQIGHWVAQTVLKTGDLRRRAEMVEFFIRTATACLSLRNYSSMASIVTTLRSSLITPLVLTWKCIDVEARDALLSMDKILDPSRNFSAYRKSLEGAKDARIPHLSVHLLDIKIMFALASPTTSPDGHEVLIPFAKYSNLYRHIVQIIMEASHHSYYTQTPETDVYVSLHDCIRQVVVDDTSMKTLERQSSDLIVSERRVSGLKRLERLFDKRPSFDGGKVGNLDEETESSNSDLESSLRQLPLPVKDLSRDIVKLGDNSVTGGGFCDVYLGEGRIDGTVEKVAMKMLRVNSAEHRVRKAFHREVELWVRVRHPFVLPFYGVSEQAGRLFMISPWVEHGNALQYLQAYPNANRRKLLWQTSDALTYLHSGAAIPPIVHGDIKAENILISGSGDALLADFGLARLVDKIAVITCTPTSIGGSSRFMAPELLLPPKSVDDFDDGMQGPRTTPRSDVYAFACLILQIFTEERPFNHIPSEPRVIFAIIQGQKPWARSPGHEAFLKGFDEDLWALANQCWAFSQQERPRMKVVSAQLREAMYRIQWISRF